MLLQIRKARGLSQSDFALKNSVNLDIYRKWEQGRTIPKWEQTFQFLKLLGQEGREELHIHIGPLIDMLRGDPTSERGRAFDALAIVFEHAPEEMKRGVLNYLEKKADDYRK